MSANRNIHNMVQGHPIQLYIDRAQRLLEEGELGFLTAIEQILQYVNKDNDHQVEAGSQLYKKIISLFNQVKLNFKHEYEAGTVGLNHALFLEKMDKNKEAADVYRSIMSKENSCKWHAMNAYAGLLIKLDRKQEAREIINQVLKYDEALPEDQKPNGRCLNEARKMANTLGVLTFSFFQSAMPQVARRQHDESALFSKSAPAVLSLHFKD